MAAVNQTEGFGYNKEESAHHFKVTIPVKKTDDVIITEHLTSEQEAEEIRRLNLMLGRPDDRQRLKVILKYTQWSAIADEVRSEFNVRLRRSGFKSSQWKIPGETLLARTYGMELVLLAWAIEDADIRLIPHGLDNWKGLQPEERWWLYTMTNAATGHAINHRNKGWRKAIRYALTENEVAHRESPEKILASSDNGTLWEVQPNEFSASSSEGELNETITSLPFKGENDS